MQRKTTEPTYTTTTRVPLRVKAYLDERETSLAGAIRMIPVWCDAALKKNELFEENDRLIRENERLRSSNDRLHLVVESLKQEVRK